MAKLFVTDIFTPAQIASVASKLHKISDDQSATHLVYFVQNGESGPIKIGYTRNIKNRMGSLRTEHGRACTLLATCPGGKSKEYSYHFQFAAGCVDKEWFHPSEALLAEIERLKAGDA